MLLLIGHEKRISLETNLVSENEPAIVSKGRQFRLSASNTDKTAPSKNPRMEFWDSTKSGKVWNGMAQSRSQSLRSAPRAYFACLPLRFFLFCFVFLTFNNVLLRLRKCYTWLKKQKFLIFFRALNFGFGRLLDFLKILP